MITWLDSDTAENEEFALEDFGLPGDLVSERTCRFKRVADASASSKAGNPVPGALFLQEDTSFLKSTSPIKLM
jgi:hypothetical protein